MPSGMDVRSVATSALNGDVRSQRRIAEMYLPKGDLSEDAITWYRVAADSGHALSCLRLLQASYKKQIKLTDKKQFEYYGIINTMLQKVSAVDWDSDVLVGSFGFPLPVILGNDIPEMQATPRHNPRLKSKNLNWRRSEIKLVTDKPIVKRTLQPTTKNKAALSPSKDSTTLPWRKAVAGAVAETVGDKRKVLESPTDPMSSPKTSKKPRSDVSFQPLPICSNEDFPPLQHISKNDNPQKKKLKFKIKKRKKGKKNVSGQNQEGALVSKENLTSNETDRLETDDRIPEKSLQVSKDSNSTSWISSLTNPRTWF